MVHTDHLNEINGFWKWWPYHCVHNTPSLTFKYEERKDGFNLNYSHTYCWYPIFESRHGFFSTTSILNLALYVYMALYKVERRGHAASRWVFGIAWGRPEIRGWEKAQVQQQFPLEILRGYCLVHMLCWFLSFQKFLNTWSSDDNILNLGEFRVA